MLVVTVGGSGSDTVSSVYVFGMAHLRHFNGIGDSSCLINKILLRLHASLQLQTLNVSSCHLCIVNIYY